MSESGGRIIVEAAYAQGKMLHSTSWNNVLARGITPSDIDFVVESDGCFLIAEFSRDTDRLEGLKRGQALLYSRLWHQTGALPWAVAICQHQVPITKQIDTMRDVKACTVYFNSNKFLQLNNAEWVTLVENWAKDPRLTLRSLNDKRDLMDLIGF